MNSTFASRCLRFSFSTVVYNGNSAAKRILHSLKKDIESYSKQWNVSRRPALGIILVGNNPASISYIKKKQQACDAIGIKHELYHFSEEIQEYDLQHIINTLNQREDIDGIMAQLPLPAHINKHNVIDMICPHKDADCLKSEADSLHPNSSILPCTPAACLKILEDHNINLEDKHVVLIGRGQLVGLPLESLLKKLSPASIITCVKETPNIKSHISKADVIIAAAGQRQLIKGKWIKKGAIVLDVGVNQGIPGVDPYKIVGDVEFDEARKSASLITPVPGGIGPMTVSMLMNNVVQIWKNRVTNPQLSSSSMFEISSLNQSHNYSFEHLNLPLNRNYPPDSSIFNYLYV